MDLMWTICHDDPDRVMNLGDGWIKKYDSRVGNLVDNQRMYLHGEAGD